MKTKSPLSVIQGESLTSVYDKTLHRNSVVHRMNEIRARSERLWLMEPESFNPFNDRMLEDRLENTWGLLNRFIRPQGLRIVDIGTGSGILALRLKEAGAQVLAIDTSENALNLLKNKDPEMDLKQGTMPFLPLQDQLFDLVICTDVIAENFPEDYRLFFSELARLVKPTGYVICSTPIDYTTDGGTERFTSLARSEFILLTCVNSYHALYLRIKRCLAYPETFLKLREHNRSGNKQNGFLNKYYYRLGLNRLSYTVWKTLQIIANPIVSGLRRSRRALKLLEKICRNIQPESGISHTLFIGKVRPLGD